MTELAHRDDSALQRRRMDYDPEQVRLIKATVAKGATDAELGMFLELAARYGLDPFAREIWCAKSQRQDGGEGRILIMIGRDGLRKLARRAGARVDQDVVRAGDRFEVRRAADGTRAIEHGYNGGQAERGAIVGAWCEVNAPEGYGFFYAPIEEYRPTSEAKLKYSPWGSQESVMILAAAERQALRMAISLAGVVVEGEAELNDERATGAVAEEEASIAWPDGEQGLRLRERFAAILELDPNAYSPAAIDLLVRGQGEQALGALEARLSLEAEKLRDAAVEPSAPSEPEEVPEAEVVEEQPVARPEPPPRRRPLVPAPEPAQPELAPEPEPEAKAEPEPDPALANVDLRTGELVPPLGEALADTQERTGEVVPPVAEVLADVQAGAIDLDPIDAAAEAEAAPVPPGGYDLEEVRSDLAYWRSIEEDPAYMQEHNMTAEEVKGEIEACEERLRELGA